MRIDWKALFLSTRGRVGRQAFWIAFAVLIVVGIVLNLIPIIGQLLALLLVWPYVAVGAKRLHDVGRTAWWMLAPLLLSIGCFVAAAVAGGASFLAAFQQNDNQAIGQAVGGLGVLLLLVCLAILIPPGFLLWLGLDKGDEGTNRYGPPPEALR